MYIPCSLIYCEQGIRYIPRLVTRSFMFDSHIMKYITSVIMLLLLATTQLLGQGSISGYVLEAETREPIAYAQVQLVGQKRGAYTNLYGFFSIANVQADSVGLLLSAAGYQRRRYELSKGEAQPLYLFMEPQSLELDSVQIQAERLPSGMGVSSLSNAFIESIPTFLGERDVIKALQYLPGVQRANDGNSSLYVRGGNGDQNLILLDEAPVYNVNHLFGFFSVFNGDAVQSVEFIKGGFPAHYGGRLSSVVAVSTREGSREQWGAKGGIGLTSSRIAIGGPVLNKKGSLLLAARRTYWDVVVRPFLDLADANSKPFFFFHDYNAKFTYDVNDRNKLIANLYSSRDRYGLIDLFNSGDTRTGFTWQNLTGSIRWNHIISPQAFANTSLFLTRYQVDLFNQGRVKRNGQRGEQDIRSGSEMLDLALKHDFYWYPNARHSLRLGGIAYQHWFAPNRLRIFRENYSVSLLPDADIREVERYSTQEIGVYVEDQWKLSPAWTMEMGVRGSAYQATGRWWFNPEPRLKLAVDLNPQHRLEASLTRMAQYIHQVSNSGLALPIDVWIPSTPDILPQRSWQANLGWTQVYPNGLRVLTELYYKTFENLIGYNEAAGFFDLDLDNLSPTRLAWQTLVTQGDGVAYGLEVQAQYRWGKHRLLGSYALSRTIYQFEELNADLPFAPRFDRRHMLSFLYQWSINARWELNAGWFFSTGNPIPLPTAQIYLQGHREIRRRFDQGPSNYLIFSKLDEYRTPLYHRLDVSLKWKAKAKERRRDWNYYWEFGAFNAYNRLNPTFFNVEDEFNDITGDQQLRIQQISLFFFTPSLSFNFSF